MRKRLPIAAAIVLLYLLHQDVWFWRTARPLVFGFLPVGLAYHALYCAAAAVLMWVLTTVAWPQSLEGDERWAGPVAGSPAPAARARRERSESPSARERGRGPASTKK